MQNMKINDKNQEWIGNIPKNWTFKKIKYVLAQRNEKNIPIKSKDILSLTAKQGVIPYTEKEGGGNKPKTDFSAYKLAYPGDIVMNSMNILSGAVGLSKYFGCVSPVYYMLYCSNDEDDIRYFYYVFANKAFQSSLLGIGNGILMKESENGTFNTIRMRIPIEKLNNMSIPYPKPEIQKAIANFLDKKIGKIDEVSKKIQQEITNLEEYRNSIIVKAVTKGLNPNVLMKDSGIPWIGKIPQQWNIEPIYLHFYQGKNKNNLGKEKNLLSLSYGKIIRKNINSVGGLLPSSYNTYNIVEAGDIIIRPTDLQNDKRSLRTGLVTEHGIITSAYLDLKPKTKNSSRYYHYLLHAYDIQKVFYNMGNGVRQGLNFSEFSKLKILVPNLKNQLAISDYLDNLNKKISKIILNKKSQLEKLNQYKQSIIYEYVTGKKQVPTEEGAKE
ncbi:restriction endonuclease subunit S [Lactobacillus amylovorus]|uniref:restriction endonuclease subunit S n=1 Tax=Lactobacillus amylovorus TaxID=1604 RepID=UPI002A799820|nr:restriction endonuclease subunit S [Ligilactobacillus salivarius]